MSSDIDKIKSEYGKALLTGEYIPQDTDSALKILEKAVKLKNINAKRFLALEYISGEHLEQDIEKGIALLTECADSGDVIASYRLGKIYLQGEIMSQNLDKAERYLLLAEDNEYTQYALAKLYLQEEKYDIQKAVNFFENCAAKNHWASYQLGRIYLFGVVGLTKDKEKAVEWFTKSANDGNEYAQAMLDNISKFENDLLANTIFSLFVSLSRCIEDDYKQKYKSVSRTVDSRLRRMISQKKSCRWVSRTSRLRAMSNHINSGIYRSLDGGLFGDNYCKAKRLYTDVSDFIT